MRDRKFTMGIGVSVLWIGVAILMLSTQDLPTKVNEWGDFIAGFSAPLAFFWLVLGYMQQGEELRHSTQALHLQAEELKNSVEQQTQLVLVAREQMKQETDALAEERRLRREAARPKFIPQQSSVTTDGAGTVSSFAVSIVNIGPTATKFRLQIELPGSYVIDDGRALFKSEQREIYNFVIPVEATAKVSIGYVDSMGSPGEAAFFMTRTQNRHLQFSDSEPNVAPS